MNISSLFNISKRRYLVAYIEGTGAYSNEIRLANIYADADGYEWQYAMQERIDEILDLKVGDSIPFRFNRDVSDSMGYVKRIG